MHILITGGAGFIGSHLVRLCQVKGDDVTVLDNLTTGTLEHLPQSGYTFWERDIRDKTTVDRIAISHFDAIVHLAAQTMVDTSLQDVSFDADENIMGTLNVLKAARKGGVKRIIFASTAAAYGDVIEKDLPIPENYPLEPTSFYGLSKITVEHYLTLYAKLFGLKYVTCRFANVYGEHQGDKGEGGVVSIFAKRIAQNLPIKIYGTGEQTRDFVYAGDIANGIYAALKTPYVNDVYNLSTQTEVSINDLVALFNQISGKKLKPIYTEVRDGDIFRSTLSNAKAKEKLQWEPQMQLEKGLRCTYNYFCSLL